jgi:hypothetical protein
MIELPDTHRIDASALKNDRVAAATQRELEAFA